MFGLVRVRIAVNGAKDKRSGREFKRFNHALFFIGYTRKEHAVIKHNVTRFENQRMINGCLRMS